MIYFNNVLNVIIFPNRLPTNNYLDILIIILSNNKNKQMIEQRLKIKQTKISLLILKKANS